MENCVYAWEGGLETTEFLFWFFTFPFTNCIIDQTVTVKTGNEEPEDMHPHKAVLFFPSTVLIY